MIYTIMAIVFVVGYLAIALEFNIHVDKAASAILTAILLWTLMVIGGDVLFADQITNMMANGTGAAGHITEGAGHASNQSGLVSHFLNTELRHHLAEISEILFFLIGAMLIVETVDAHDGFEVITNRITTTNAMTLLWVIGGLTFFMSALLDNLTTTIVMISLLRKLVGDKDLRWWFVGMVIIAANAGGAWSPIGDVTTTMLWIGGQISVKEIIINIIVPSMVAAIIPMAVLSLKLKGKTIARPTTEQLASNTGGHGGHGTTAYKEEDITPKLKVAILCLGVSALVFVPVFKSMTHLPPYMGMLLGLSVLWIFTEIVHRNSAWETKQHATVVSVLKRVEMTSVLFFLGILLAVASLATAGHLAHTAGWLDNAFGNLYIINVLIGLLSSVVANVPLVAGAMKMYPLLDTSALQGLEGAELIRQQAFIHDGNFWHFLAYCAGTGGSCLIIGSAAGVAAMGMEKIPFFWYLKRISWLALIGYLAGAATYVAIHVM